jgi:hypothetical protein
VADFVLDRLVTELALQLAKFWSIYLAR